MLNFIVSGQVPGTSFQFSFLQVAILFACMAIITLARAFYHRAIVGDVKREIVLTPQQW